MAWLRWLSRFLSGRATPDPLDRARPEPSHEPRALDGDDEDGAFDPEAPVELPIEDALDLHPFRPSDVKHVVRDYLDAAVERGLREVRIIHGRGIGAQRRTVRTLLERDPRVQSFSDATADRGGWGATVVVLRGGGERGSLE